MLQCAWLVALILILSTVGQFPMDENKCSTCEATYSCLGDCDVSMVDFCSTVLSDPSCIQEQEPFKNETCGDFFADATPSSESTALCPRNVTTKSNRPSLCDCCRERINACAQQLIDELKTNLDDAADPTHGASNLLVPSDFASQTCTRMYGRFVCAKLLRRQRNEILCGDFCCRIRLECPFFRVEHNQLYGGQPILSCEEKSPTGCFSYSNMTTTRTSNFTESPAESWNDPCGPSSKGSNLSPRLISSSATILISLIGLIL